VVRVPGQNLTAEEQFAFSQVLGDPINSKNSQMMKRPNRWLHADVDGIFLAGNIDNTGKVEYGMQRSEYWHHDADFMLQGKNMVFNILHTQVMADAGGDTGFIDNVVEGEELAEFLDGAKTRVSLTDISDYEGDEKDHEVFHDVIQPHPYTGVKVAYLPQGILFHEGEKYSNSMDVFAPIIESRPRYVHTWESGDVLIWDNLSTMHRSIGGFDGGRLLHRTQVFYMNHLQAPASAQ
jgi:alpha-ketoglutarate-dependent taurine dioxygenase